MGETSLEETCAYCLKPIRKEELPAVRMDNGDFVHVWCWSKYTPPSEQRPN